jgi:transposase
MKLHVFATILALYPFTKTEDIAKEFGISVVKVRRMARICRVSKNAEFRSEIGRLNGSKRIDRVVKKRIRREQRAVKLWNDGLTMGEIAMRLDISKKTVYKYLLQAKKKVLNLTTKRNDRRNVYREAGR